MECSSSSPKPVVKYRLDLAYEGTHFLGWDARGGGRTIQGTLKKAIEEIVLHDVELDGASRTDRGVHAMQQVAAFTTCHPVERLLERLNVLLPKEIRIYHVEEVPSSFHPTLHSQQKWYRYQICNLPVQPPLWRHHSWHLPTLQDTGTLAEATQLFVGTHNFYAFCNRRKELRYQDYTRTIHSITLRYSGDGLIFIDVVGTLFLYKMVRNICGTAVDIVRGRIDAEKAQKLLIEGERRDAGLCAPAHGLFLMEILY